MRLRMFENILFCPGSGPLRRLSPEQDEGLFRACHRPGASALSPPSLSYPVSVLSDQPRLDRLVKSEGFGVERSGFKSQFCGVGSAHRRSLESALLESSSLPGRQSSPERPSSPATVSTGVLQTLARRERWGVGGQGVLGALPGTPLVGAGGFGG